MSGRRFAAVRSNEMLGAGDSMTVIYTADVFCDKCGDWTHGVTLDRNSGLARKAIVASKREGWSRHARSQYLDLCPKCLAEFRAEVPND